MYVAATLLLDPQERVIILADDRWQHFPSMLLYISFDVTPSFKAIQYFIQLAKNASRRYNIKVRDRT